MCSCGRTFVTELGKVLLRCLGENLLGLADSLVWLDAVLFVSFVPQYLVYLHNWQITALEASGLPIL